MNELIDQSSAAVVCSVAWVRSTSELASLHREWKALVEQIAEESVFVHFDWVATWWEHFGSGSELAILTVRDERHGLIGLAPFYISRSLKTLGLRRLGFIGDKHTGSDYLRLIAHKAFWEEVVTAVSTALIEARPSWDYIELLDSDNDIVNCALALALRGNGLTVAVSPASTCRHIPLPATFESYLASIGGNLRGNFRRRLRNLRKAHNVEFECIRVGQALEQSYERLLVLHERRFRTRGKKSAFTGSQEVRQFHLHVARRLACQDLVRLFQLTADGKVIAALYGFQLGTRFQFFQCGMHPDWLTQGIGQITVGLSIEGAIELGCVDFDFLRGDEEYKSKWASDYRYTQNVCAYPRTPSAQLFRVVRMGVDRVRRSLSPLLRRAPDGQNSKGEA
jgi:CelD/BcsL family acetyltransferase involved in cellulose biosynthesis